LQPDVRTVTVTVSGDFDTHAETATSLCCVCSGPVGVQHPLDGGLLFDEVP